MAMVASLYRKYMPIRIRYRIGKLRAKKVDKENLKKIRSGAWKNTHKIESEYMIKKGKVLTFPYPWSEQYDEKSIDVYKDPVKKMPYILVDGKRLYFPKRYPISYIRTYFNSLIMEQDSRSSHYYFEPSDPILKNSVFFDVGGAEGYISLRVLPFVDKVILFECDQDWIKALQTTFEPWRDKVEIINKYADAQTKENKVRIDDIAIDKTNIVLKLDVEGMEAAVLHGASKTLEKSDTKVFVCTYHNKNDEKELGDLLRNFGFEIQKSEGYMFYGGRNAGFRKGMIRAWKK